LCEFLCGEMGNIVKKAIENPEKEKNIRDAFREFDRNKNGRLEKSEWVSFAKELRKTLRFGDDVAGEAAYIERVFHLADSDGDGVVSYDEFRDFIRSHSYVIGEDDGAKGMREKGKEEEEDSPKHPPSSSSSSSSSLSPPPELCPNPVIMDAGSCGFITDMLPREINEILNKTHRTYRSSLVHFLPSS
jgi:hypothetical protein